jgi:tetratricopeptide (TPR) repeat protein
MKLFVITLAILCVAATAGTIIYLNMPKAQPAAAPVTEASSLEQTETPPPKKMITPKQRQSQIVSADTSVAKEIPAAAPVSTEATPVESGKSTALSKAIEVLISPQSSFDQKQAAWKQLRDDKQLDQAVGALKQGAANNPTSAEYPAALGQAYLQQAGIAARSGKSINEMGILGMQADQSFDAALNLDPANWDAQFFKAVAMAHWPAELNKGDEVLQRFSTLIVQQETMTPQPQFAKTYVLLGEQYQKMGKPDFATATWQLGATKFPSDPVLQTKANGH